MQEGTDSQGTDELVGDIAIIAAACRAEDCGERWSREATRSFDRFHQRFVKRIYAHCKRKIAGSLPRGTCLTSFVVDLVYRLAHHLHRLRVPPDATSDQIEQSVLVFAARQAEWALKDLFREAEAEKIPKEVAEAIGTRGARRDQPSTAEYVRKRTKLDDVLNAMPPKARDVLLTSFDHMDQESDTIRLPEHERDRLCREHKFASPNALVVYRRRVLAELKHALSAVA